MAVETTKLNRGWLVKMAIYLVVLLGLGVWGLVDGIWVYPARGEKVAQFQEREYLAKAQAAGRLLTARIQDPQAEYRNLRDAEGRLTEEMNAARAEGRATQVAEREMSLALLNYLTALSRIGRLDPAYTMPSDPVLRLEELNKALATEKQPKPLSAFDLPAQWLIAAGGLGFGAWIVAIFLIASTRKFRFDPAEDRLTLPGGKSITPADIAEVDKRKWDKYFVFLRLKNGGEVKLDLLRYSPLEQWVLEMEKKTDGYEPPPPDSSADAPAETSAAAQ